MEIYNMETYQVIIADSLEELEVEVNRLIHKGYEPQGGICVVKIAPRVSQEDYYVTYQYYQAMRTK